MARAMNKLHELKFDFQKTRSEGELIEDMEAFVEENFHDDFELKAADMEAISDPVGTCKAPDPLLMVEHIKLRDLRSRFPRDNVG